VSQCTEREHWRASSTVLFDKLFPHKPSSGVIGEGEVNCFIIELLEFFFGTLFGFVGAADDSDTRLICDELCSPFTQSFLDSCGVGRVCFLLFTSLFLAFFLCWENFFSFINVDDTWLKFLGCYHDGSYHDIFLFFG
jgi:hypothetical protein